LQLISLKKSCEYQALRLSASGFLPTLRGAVSVKVPFVFMSDLAEYLFEAVRTQFSVTSVVLCLLYVDVERFEDSRSDLSEILCE
jgi:hypothetical protein